MGDLSGIEPPRMDWSAPDLQSALQAFKQYCTLIFAGPLSEKDKEAQVTYILIWIGQEGLKMFTSWGVSEDDRKDPAKIWDHFEKHIAPKSNFRLNRFHLQKFKQNSTETIDEFMTRCKLQALKCKFRDAKEQDERLIEQLIIGTRHKKVQELLLGKDEKLTLDKALDIARTREATQVHMEQLGTDSSAVHAIKHSQSRHSYKKHPKCKHCGGSHAFRPREKCPAYGTTCNSCGKSNHWEIVCMSKSMGADSASAKSYSRSRSSSRHRRSYKHKSVSPGPKHKQFNEIHDQQHRREPTLEESFDTLTFGTIDINMGKDNRDEVFAQVDITLTNKPQTPATLKVKVDTGAQGNILPLRIYRRMYPENLDSDGFPKHGSTVTRSTVLTAYNGTKIPQFGTTKIPCRYKDKSCHAEFYVTDSEGPAIMGLPTSRELSLVILNCTINSSVNSVDDTNNSLPPINSKDDLVKLYPDRFKGIGNFKGTFHITLDPDVPPVVHAPRRCPIHLRDELKHELEEMENIGVFTKVTEPTDWVSSLAYSRKANGKLRICLDPKDLNEAIKRPHYKTPTLDETTHKFAGATVFSKLDARHGYWSVSLDEESSRLTTFNSPFGRYCFRRLPFGLNMSQDVFQERMDQILELCPGTTGIADDVAVFGTTQADHDKNIHNLLKVAREHGLVFNIDKCEINKPSIKFFGLVYDANGVHPDPDKVRDIREMEAPSDAKKLQEFLGIVTYMSPFIPHLSQLTAPLRELIKSDTVFIWSKSHQVAFETIVSLICREVTLSYFDPQQPSTLQVDASSRGLGAVLMQSGKPIAFASKSLTDTEQRYANIEREMLAVVFGCEKFHTYLYGKHFTVESDHKPLEMIHLKNLSAAPQRLQRMLLRIQPYDLTIKYRPGKEVLVADALSRSPGSDKSEINFDVKIHLVQFSTQKLETLRDDTRNDPELRELMHTITTGWPAMQRLLPFPLRPYWSYRDELTIEDGIIMKGDRVIIPAVMREEILEKLHESHQGIEKTKLRARTCVYWNNINADIEKLVRRCGICQHAQTKQRPEPLQQHELPTRPWQVLGTDLFYLNGEDYLIISDYYSKFPLVRKIRGKSTGQAIVELVKCVFAEQGVPETVISDNGPQFDCNEFRAFAEAWGFDHVTSSPHYPQSNGFIERQIQTVKHTLTKAKTAGIDMHMALLILRSTPIDHHLSSPAELLNSRKMKANLPTKIRNQASDKDSVMQRLQERQLSQKNYYDDKAGHDLAPVIVGQHVRVQDQSTRKWTPAIVSNVRPEPRSYEVQTPSGAILRRNRRHIRETSEQHASDNREQHASDNREQHASDNREQHASDTAYPILQYKHSSVQPAKHVRFQMESRASDNSDSNTTRSYYTRSGRLVKRPNKFDP